MHEFGQYFGFEISEALYQRSLQTMADIAKGGSEATLNAQIAENLIDICEAGLDAYYHKPADLVSIAPVVRKAADAGISAIRKGVQMVIRKVFTKTPLSELQVLARYMADLLTYDDSGDQRRYFITFPLNDELYTLSQRLLARVRQDPNVDSYREDIVQSLIDLIEAGVKAYYHEPVGMISLGSLTRKTADFGISTSQKGANAVVHRLFKVLPHAEMIPLSGYFETLLHSGLKNERAV